MFTRQQIEEIKRGLEFYSRKDSQLPESPLPLDGTELVSIIKNGQNVVTTIDNVADPEGHRENPLIYHKGPWKGLTQTEPYTYADYLAEESKKENTLYICQIDGIVEKLFIGATQVYSIDGELNTESDNPVKNKVVKNAVDDLQAQINDIRTGSSEISVSLSSSVIFSGEPTDITISANMVGLPIGTIAKSMTISRGGTQLKKVYDSNSISVIDEDVSTAVTYTIEAVLFDTEVHKSTTRSVAAVGHIYYGSGSSVSDFWSNKVMYDRPVTTPYRDYEIHCRVDGNHLYIAVPSNMTIHGATMNGFIYPLDAPDTTSQPGMAIYRGSNDAVVGDYIINVN